ncbi:MAG: MFS transporter [Devosia sp.]|uniref:MFS transporter n=1 Tax=Devosia sp. 66-22 TaxID=1895753 RepID=UPI0009270094|nr:MFS transporter [Devosia sp. 66-22]MBN9344879.1 MFS transporter [Devosia sp.]OJX50526.1 MAG: MFS transporter [Devosia sp. 66-22]
MSPALLALFAAAFAIGTSEFVIAGILPAVSTDLGISIPTAGLLVSLYALGVAVGGPLLATFAGRYSRKLLLLSYVAIFTIGYVFCALAPNYTSLLVARVIIALIHGAYFGTAMVVSTTVVDESRRGFAVALILSGLTVANIVGVPLGTAIGTAFGWRMTFWAVAALGVVSFTLIALLVPRDSAHQGQSGSLLAEIRVLAREPVYTSLAVIVLQTIGQFALFTYISPLLTDVSGIPLDVVPWLLLIFGIGSTIGVLVGGRLADWRLMASLTGILAAQVVIYALMGVFVAAPWAMAVLVLIWGSTVFAFGSPVQTRILSNTQDAPLLAASLIPSAFNISIAAGAWLGGLMIDQGYGYHTLPWIGVVGAVLSVAIAYVSWMRERRS